MSRKSYREIGLAFLDTVRARQKREGSHQGGNLQALYRNVPHGRQAALFAAVCCLLLSGWAYLRRTLRRRLPAPPTR